MERRTYIVGISPGPDGISWNPESRSVRLLAKLCGVEPEELRERFELTNLCPVHLPNVRCVLRMWGLQWDPPREDGERFILCGHQVYKAIGWGRTKPWPKRKLPDWRYWSEERPMLRWYVSASGHHMAILPHPSGLNRWYNDEKNRAAARRFLLKTMREDASR